MNKRSKTLIAFATAGILAGFTAPSAWAGDDAHGGHPAAEATKDGCAGKDGCSGKDSCSGKDGCSGTEKKEGDHAADSAHGGSK